MKTQNTSKQLVHFSLFMAFITIVLWGLSVSCSGAEINPKFLQSLHQVEASGRTGAIVGDGGKALGPFQIHYEYWVDAVAYDRTIGGKYEDVKDLSYAKKVVAAYLNRYCSNAVRLNDFETMARVHNGGPKGHLKASTLPYWNKVKKQLDKR